MTPLATPDQGGSLIILEGGLTTIAIAFAFLPPRISSWFFSPVERAFGRLARRQGLSVIVVGVTAFLLRLAILPLSPIPHPFLPDDFSFLLASDTFASGRLTNPTPAMWVHFESIHITMQPTYMSMYFPAQGLVMAGGKVLAGNPWYGILCSTALMCAAICWMLQAWLPPTWALLGGMIAVLRLGLFSYWINTYTGAGEIAALGGALVLGALPRLMKTFRLRDGLLMAIGVILLANSRPYEGILLCLPVAFVLGRWIFVGSNRPSPAMVLRRTALPLVLVLFAGAWMGYYDYRAFGSPLTLPYKIDRATYAMAPYFVWQSARPEPVYRHKVMRDLYYHELTVFEKNRSLHGFILMCIGKSLIVVLFFGGIALLPPLIMLRRVLLDRRIRFLLVCLLVLMAGMLIEIFLIPHYLAPFTAVFYALGLQAMRHLRMWRPGGQQVGIGLVRLIVTVCIAMAGLRLYATPLHLRIPKKHDSDGIYSWSGPGQFGTARANVEFKLEQLPGRHLVIVRYSPHHNSLDEWVYNAADIDHSKVIWAREMDAASNCELMQYYKDRKVWLVQPDLKPTSVSPYPSACQ